MVELFYRMISGNFGIYEAVDKDCLKTDDRRLNKPDGSWLPKIGMNYPNAISFWKEFGLFKYIKSGLLDWHILVTNEPVFVQTINKPSIVLYEDEFQIICDPKSVQILSQIPIKDFLNQYK